MNAVNRRARLDDSQQEGLSSTAIQLIHGRVGRIGFRLLRMLT